MRFGANPPIQMLLRFGVHFAPDLSRRTGRGVCGVTITCKKNSFARLLDHTLHTEDAAIADKSEQLRQDLERACLRPFFATQQ